MHIGIDDDDSETLSGSLCIRDRFICHITPRRNYKCGIDQYCRDMAKEAQGDWIWILNDDMEIQCRESAFWDVELSKFPTTGYIIHPDIYKVNNSEYRHQTMTGCPIVPNSFFKEHCSGTNSNCLDSFIEQRGKEIGWRSDWLRGVTVWHDWNGGIDKISV